MAQGKILINYFVTLDFVAKIPYIKSEKTDKSLVSKNSKTKATLEWDATLSNWHLKWKSICVIFSFSHFLSLSFSLTAISLNSDLKTRTREKKHIFNFLPLIPFSSELFAIDRTIFISRSSNWKIGLLCHFHITYNIFKLDAHTKKCRNRLSSIPLSCCLICFSFYSNPNICVCNSIHFQWVLRNNLAMHQAKSTIFYSVTHFSSIFIFQFST